MIVLMTDFGDSEYVGVMRGVIFSASPASQVVDLTHSVPPQSVREGAWILLNSYKHFPRNTIFVSVIDPGVGTERDAVIVETQNYIHIGPDNGLLYPAARDDGIERVYRIQIPESASKTFHGRDVFALAAGFLERGVSDLVNRELKSGLDVPLTFYQEGGDGEVVRIDRFGNIITNIPPLRKGTLTLKSKAIERELQLKETYGAGSKDDVFLVVGSYGTIEIAAKNAAACQTIPLRVGERVSLE